VYKDVGSAINLRTCFGDDRATGAEWFFRYMFANSEQFRRFILPHIPAKDMKVIPYMNKLYTPSRLVTCARLLYLKIKHTPAMDEVKRLYKGLTHYT
jgi:hypothetical protein